MRPHSSRDKITRDTVYYSANSTWIMSDVIQKEGFFFSGWGGGFPYRKKQGRTGLTIPPEGSDEHSKEFYNTGGYAQQGNAKQEQWERLGDKFTSSLQLKQHHNRVKPDPDHLIVHLFKMSYTVSKQTIGRACRIMTHCTLETKKNDAQ